MGKETKIGLAVIAVLMTVFGVLLFRHLQASHELPMRGLGDQTAVQPLPTHTDVAVASEESRITGSKLWDTPTTNETPATAEVVGDESTDPYQAGTAEPENGAPVNRSPFQRGSAIESHAEVADAGAPRSNPLRRASAEFPVETPHEPAAASGDEVVTDPLMTVPDASESAAADPYAGEEVAPAPAESPVAPAPESQLPTDSRDDEPTEPQAGAALRDPFDQAPPVETAPEPLSEDAQPLAETAPDSQPQQPSSQFDRFESSAAETAVSESVADAAAPDAWRGRAPAAAPLTADASEAAPLPIENGMYTVQPGDSLWTVSEAVYGTGGYFKALAAHNRASLPKSDKLTVGSQLSVPPVEDLQRDFPSLCPRPRKSAVVKAGATRASAAQPRSGRDIYIVNEGDTLFTIARYELGKATRWAEIYDLNRAALGEDFDYLRPGMELVMPARGTEAASQPAESRY